MTLDGSCDDLYASQNYLHAMNYSENENDFQTLKLDETLFENPSSRSRSEAQLSNVVFTNNTGLQGKAKKLSDLSNEKVLEFYDLHTPKSSPRRNKVSCSTGDLASEPSPSLIVKDLKPAPRKTESPLVNQQEQTVTVTIEQTDCAMEKVEQGDATVNNEQVTSSNEDDPADSSVEPIHVTMPPSVEIYSLQENNASYTSKGSQRDTLTGTPDSGIVVSEESNDTILQGNQSVKLDNTSDGSVVIDSKSDTSSIHSTTHHTVTEPKTNTADLVINEEPTTITSNTATWETVADRKKRYLQALRKLSSEEHEARDLVSSPVTQDEAADSTYGNSDDEGSTTLLSSSQPILNLTKLEDPKPALRDDSSSDSDMEEMQAPLMSVKLSPHDIVLQTSYVNPLLSDHSDDESSDEDCEMVQPSEVTVYRSLVRSGTQDAMQHRASHPPLKRTLNYEQVSTNNLAPKHSKKLRHKPSLNSIVEEDGDNIHHTNTL